MYYMAGTILELLLLCYMLYNIIYYIIISLEDTFSVPEIVWRFIYYLF
jgi:hypothetical protein